MALARLPWGISRSPERLMMAVYAIGVPALAVCCLQSGQRSRRVEAILMIKDEAVEEMVPGYFSQRNWIS